MSVAAVPDPDPTPDGIPDFNGKPVSATKLTIGHVNNLECDDTVLEIDQIVRLTVEARITDVKFAVDEKSGDLVRHQRAKAVDVEFSPWDPSDPNDRGVMP